MDAVRKMKLIVNANKVQIQIQFDIYYFTEQLKYKSPITLKSK